MKVVTVEQMQAIERAADSAGVSYARMMENAGRAMAQELLARSELTGKQVVILVGPGNNGGDGLVAGRYLAQAGAKVLIYLLKERSDDDPNLKQVLDLQIPVLVGPEHLEQLAADVRGAAVVVDALLGTGSDRPIGGALKGMLDTVREALDAAPSKELLPRSLTQPSLVVSTAPLAAAVDCPSGLNCDTGVLDPAAIPADLTVTFDSPKLGYFLFPGAEAVGELLVADIEIPADLPAKQSVDLELVDATLATSLLPVRSRGGHKGTFGKVMIAGGSLNYTGAPGLAAEAAYRCGAGLVTLAVAGALHVPLAARITEATFVLLPHLRGAISEAAASVLLEALEGYDALLVGPGLGRDDETGLFLRHLFAGKGTVEKAPIGFAHGPRKTSHPVSLPPLVVDADALNLLAETKDWPQLLPAGSVLTPHPGEMARLLGSDMESVQSNRLSTAQEAARSWGHVVVLKGAFTVIAAPDGRTSLLPFATSALATAGSGDVLAGAITALVGMGLEPYQAAQLGGFLHGMAGLRSAEEVGPAGVMAGDLVLELALAAAELSDR